MIGYLGDGVRPGDTRSCQWWVLLRKCDLLEKVALS